MKTRIFTLLIAFLTMVGNAVWAETVSISDATGLKSFAERVNGGETTLNAVLTDDINLDGSITNQWAPIKDFRGTFDGGNHTISGIYIKDFDRNLGFFSSVTGEIKNLTILGEINVSINSGCAIGGLSAEGGQFTNCHSKVDIIVDIEGKTPYNVNICGLAHEAANIDRCSNHGNITVKVSGNSQMINIGGLVSTISFSNSDRNRGIKQSYNAGDIIVESKEEGTSQTISYMTIGGVAATSQGSYMKSCFNIGNITVKEINVQVEDFTIVGGLIGIQAVQNIEISDSYNKGTFIFPENFTGGNLIGNIQSSVLQKIEANISNSYYCSDIETVGQGDVTEVNVQQKEEAAFQSGEVAWLLYKGGYGQRIETDEHPVLISLGNEGTEVYKLVLSSEEVEADTYPTYVNAGTEIAPFEDLTLEEGKTIGWYKGDDLVATDLTYIVNSADADEDATISLTAKIIDEPEEEPEQPGGEGDDEQGGITPDAPKYYNIYEEEICEGVTVEFSRDVVKEGQSVLVTITVDEEFDATKMTLKFKRSLFGYWVDLTLTPTENPNEYIIENIYTDIYVRAEGAVPTGIEDINGAKVYTKDGSIYVQTPKQEQVTIISASGAVLKNEQQVGLKQYTGLQRGIYIICIDEARFKVRL